MRTAEELGRPIARKFLMFSLLLLLVIPGGGAAAESPEVDGSVKDAIASAEAFLQAFTTKDMEKVGAFFAPGAVVQRARLGEAAPEIASFGVAEWLAEAGESIDSVEDFRIEPLGSTGLSFGAGVTVSIHFRATGSVPGGTFTNDGVDSFSFAEIDGSWKIVLYNSMEKLTFKPNAPDQ